MMMICIFKIYMTINYIKDNLTINNKLMIIIYLIVNNLNHNHL